MPCAKDRPQPLIHKRAKYFPPWQGEAHDIGHQRPVAIRFKTMFMPPGFQRALFPLIDKKGWPDNLRPSSGPFNLYSKLAHHQSERISHTGKGVCLHGQGLQRGGGNQSNVVWVLVKGENFIGLHVQKAGGCKFKYWLHYFIYA